MFRNPLYPDSDLESALRQCIESHSRPRLAVALETEIERVEALTTDESLPEEVLESLDDYLCTLQYLEHCLHADLELNDQRLSSIYSRAAAAQKGLISCP